MAEIGNNGRKKGIVEGDRIWGKRGRNAGRKGRRSKYVRYGGVS